MIDCSCKNIAHPLPFNLSFLLVVQRLGSAGLKSIPIQHTHRLGSFKFRLLILSAHFQFKKFQSQIVLNRFKRSKNQGLFENILSEVQKGKRTYTSI